MGKTDLLGIQIPGANHRAELRSQTKKGKRLGTRGKIKGKQDDGAGSSMRIYLTSGPEEISKRKGARGGGTQNAIKAGQKAGEKIGSAGDLALPGELQTSQKSFGGT